MTMNKTQMAIEGKPAGWGQIETIRISAWRGRDADTEFYLSDLRKTGVLGGRCQSSRFCAAITRSSNCPKKNAASSNIPESMAEAVHKLGVGCAVLSDLELTAGTLAQSQTRHPALQPRHAGSRPRIWRFISGDGGKAGGVLHRSGKAQTRI